jgi:hypothetical protein
MVILLIVFLTLEKNSLLTELDNQRLSRRTNKRNIKREREGKEKPWTRKEEEKTEKIKSVIFWGKD